VVPWRAESAFSQLSASCLIKECVVGRKDCDGSALAW
jgi:hypothetical protein